MLHLSLRDRVVVVTGAGRGFGRLIAIGLAAHGARVIGTAVRSADELAETARLARAAGPGTFEPLRADVSEWEDCEHAVNMARARFGRIDAVVNNAARGPAESHADYFAAKPKFWEGPPDAWRRMVETNLLGAFFLARAATPHLVAQGFGRIVNLSTSGPTMTMPGTAAYGATKAGLEAATALWAKDLAGTGVTANVLLPGGPCDTALIPGGAVGLRADAAFRAGQGPRGDEGAVGRLLPADIIVPPALWLCSDESAAWNGRRFVAKDWDPTLACALAAERAVTAQQPFPRVL